MFRSLAWLQPICLAVLTSLLVATPLLPSESVHLGTGVIFNALWLLLLLTWLMGTVARPEISLRIDVTTAMLLAFVVLHCLSAWIMASSGNPRLAINAAWKWVSFAVAFLLTRQLARRPAAGRALCSAMLGLAVCLSVHGYHQYFYSMPQTRDHYRADAKRTLEQRGFDPTPGSPGRVLFENRLASSEPFATFALTNSLAGFLVPWLVLVVAVGGLALADGPRTPRVLAGLALSCATVAGCLLLTKSRTAYVATAAGLVLLFAGGRLRRFGWRLPLAAAAGGVLLVVMAIVSRGVDRQVLSEAPKSLLYRFQYWQATRALVRDFPWWGCGPGQFQGYYSAYKLPEASETVADPHNFLLEVWATAGMPAAILFTAFLACFAWQVSRRPVEGRVRQRPGEPASGEIRFVYAGAAAGVLLAYPVGWLVGFQPAAAVLVWGLPVAIGVVALLHPWTRHGTLPAAVPVIAVCAVLVNLLGAGGIGFPGVAGSLWLLMAVALNITDAPRRSGTMPRAGRILLFVVTAVLLVAFYRTQYSPTLRGRALLARAQKLDANRRLNFQLRGLQDPGRGFAEVVAAFRQAVDADPYSPVPRMQLAALCHQQWMATQNRQHQAAFAQAVDAAMTRQPRSYGAHRQVGLWHLQAYRTGDEIEHLHAARDALARAVECYPHRSIARAELAWVYHLAHQTAMAHREAREALRLDRLNPHAEHQLSAHRMPDPGPLPEHAAGQPSAPDTADTSLLMRRLSQKPPKPVP